MPCLISLNRYSRLAFGTKLNISKSQFGKRRKLSKGEKTAKILFFFGNMIDFRLWQFRIRIKNKVVFNKIRFRRYDNFISQIP